MLQLSEMQGRLHQDNLLLDRLSERQSWAKVFNIAFYLFNFLTESFIFKECPYDPENPVEYDCCGNQLLSLLFEQEIVYKQEC